MNKEKKVLFVATVDSHILQFHIPYLKWFKEKGYEVHVATNGEKQIPYCDKKHKLCIERSPIKINNLKADDKLILDLTNYNNLVSSYNEYIANLEAEIMPTIKAIDSTMIYVVISTIGSLSVIAMVLVSKKFLFK